jgi:hypothetical protein
MNRWQYRCAGCGNPRHFFRFYAVGAAAWFVLIYLVPTRWLPLWLCALAGDYAYDHRHCSHTCGPDLFEERSQ